jgi:hypothetical protein
VVNDRHLRKRPMIFTTNKPLREWGKVLHDEDMAAAILDRVLERGRLIHLDGPSGRTRHLNLEETLPSGVERARIFGTHSYTTSGLVTCRGATITRLRICCYVRRSEALLTQQQHSASTASPCCIRSNELTATGH